MAAKPEERRKRLGRAGREDHVRARLLPRPQPDAGRGPARHARRGPRHGSRWGADDLQARVIASARQAAAAVVAL